MTFGLVAVAAVAWIYLFTGVVEKMPTSGDDSMLMQPAWTVAYAAAILAMWAIMMVAMMLPVGAPAIMQAVRRANSALHGPGGLWAGLIFAAAYMSVWLGFCVAATLLQWGLDSTDLLSENMAVRSRVIAGLLAIAVGLYQFGPPKFDALRRCRTSDRSFLDNSIGSVASIALHGSVAPALSL